MTPRYRTWQYAVASAVFLGVSLAMLGWVLRLGANSYAPLARATIAILAGILGFIGIRYVMLANLARASGVRRDAAR